MAPPADPYRTLGLGRDATLDQVKRAYRRLAKVHHPDTAGEGEVPRFLAIKAAYEAIAGPDATDASRAGRRAATPRRAWEADPDRADATRRAYGSRGRARPAPGARPAGPEPGARPAGPEPGARPAGPGPAGGRPGPDDAPQPPPPPGSDGPERPPNLATLGSTTYDGTEGQPFEPDWGGASWYGTTSGTYWTLNPKEYADPRKHGPEYQARARRARRGEADAAATAPGPTPASVEAAPATAPPPTTQLDPEPEADADGGRADAAGSTPPGPPPAPATGPTATTASWWDATAGPGPADPGPVAPPWTAPAPISQERSGGAERFGVIERVGRAALGWAPIALAIGALAGSSSGTPIAAVGQVVVLAILVLVPLLARLASTATIVTAVVAIPATLILGAIVEPTGPVGPDSIPPGLAVALLVAWLAGLAIAGLRESRRPPRPVS